MSASQSAATGPPPVDAYPSPPASPESVKVVGRPAGPREALAIANFKLATDFSDPTERPVTPEEDGDARPLTPAASTACEAHEAESAKEASELAIWREALSLSGMECGATRKDGQSCKKKISTKKRKSIDSTIMLLWIASNSSLQVEAHLDDLAKLVHCHYHDPPPFREARVRHWMVALPGGPRMLSVQKLLRDILGGRPAKCTAIAKKEGKPCKNPIGNQDWFYADETIERMIQVALEPTDKDHPLTFLKTVLQHHLLCYVHQKWSCKQQDEWVARVNRFYVACQAELNRRNKDTAMTKEATAREREADHTAHDGRLPSPPPTPNSKKVFGNPRTYWNTTYETSEWKILGAGDILDEGKSAVDEIREVAQQSLNTAGDKSESEVYDGFVYLYKVAGNENLVKIGFTTGDVTKRVEKWKKDCHRESVVLYPSPAGTAAVAVPHAHRVERLVHAELAEHRVRVYCERCKQQHKEWFEVSAERAAAALEKWSLWMRGRPYDTRGTRSAVTWYLKASEAKRLADVANFLKELEAAVAAAGTAK